MFVDRGPSPAIVSGRYQVEGTLGVGGHAVVLRVTDQRLGVARALKVLTPSLARKAKTRARFEGEARTMAGIEHPNVLRVYDVAEEGGLPYYVMELVEGGSLAQRLEVDGPFGPTDAVNAALQVCAGLEVAHARGVVHRDIKPHNVLVSGDGLCKLMDFGIAHVDDLRRTREGAALGTDGYMSPEQGRDASRVDVRADVYSVGILVFVLATGRDPVEWLAGKGQIRLPEPLRTEVVRATDEEVSRRHASVSELAECLRRCLPALPPGRGVLSGPMSAAPDGASEGDDDDGGEIADWLAALSNADEAPTAREAEPPRRAGYVMSRPAESSSQEAPSWIAEATPPPAGHVVVGLSGTTDSAPVSSPGSADDSALGPSRSVSVRWLLIPLALVAISLVVATQFVRRTHEGEAAESRSETQLHAVLRSEIGLVGTLAELGSDRAQLESLVAAWERTTTEPERSIAALALVDHLSREVGRLVDPASASSPQVRTRLGRLRTAADGWRLTHDPPP